MKIKLWLTVSAVVGLLYTLIYINFGWPGMLSLHVALGMISVVIIGMTRKTINLMTLVLMTVAIVLGGIGFILVAGMFLCVDLPVDEPC